MSADNWTECPKCEENFKKAKYDSEADLKNKYGKLDADAYLKLANKVRATQEVPSKPTLREDYEIGTFNGEFTVNYCCSCYVCGFSFEFTKDIDVLKPETD